MRRFSISSSRSGEDTPLVQTSSRALDNYVTDGSDDDKHEEAYMDLKKSLSYDEAALAQLYADDEKSETITMGRIVARYLSRFSWYYPGNTDATDDNIDTPLDKAWAFFEHEGLPRCFADKRDRNGGFLRAKVTSSDSTMLYPWHVTPDIDLGAFGIGVGLYFLCLKFFSLIFFIAGIISIPNMMYFSSDDYATDRDSIMTKFLVASALCTETSWEPCPTCTLDDWKTFPSTYSRIATGTSPKDGSILYFIKTNHCELSSGFGITTFVTMIFIICSVFAFVLLQKKWIVALDEDRQTSSDYSIKVDNPPIDARDTEVWKEFFESRFDGVHVTLCTVVLDNEELVELLSQRRTLYRKLENMLPETEEFDSTDLASVIDKIPELPKWKVKYLRSPTPQSMYERLQELDAEIEALSETKFNVSGVFITFETEQSQRRVLEMMSFPKLQSDASIPEEFMFEGKKLVILEPDEPSSIRWADLDVSELKRAKQMGISTLLAIGLIVAGAIIIAWTWAASASMYSFTVIVINLLTPSLVTYISNIEAHPNETSYMSSLYLKTSLLRWTFSAIIALIITPFAETLQNGGYFLDRIYSLFQAELVTKPILQFLDIGGNLSRHYFGPRAPDQRQMNQKFVPPQVNIGERYTDVTKVLFFTFMFSTVFPPAYFFAAAILAINYLGDKYRLFRCWASNVKINSEIVDFSDFFLLASLAAYTIMTAYTFAEFPFDNSCPTDELAPSSYVGNHSVYVESILTTNSVTGSFDVNVASGDTSYKFCEQDLFRTKKGRSYPPVASHQPDDNQWMSPDQAMFSNIFGWTSVVVVIIVGVIVLRRFLKAVIYPLFFNSYKAIGKATDISFSNVNGEIYGYVPQVKLPGYLFPFLLCDVDGIEKDLIGWSSYDESFDKYNMIFDVPKSFIAKMNERENTAFEDPGIFSVVKQWKPTS